MGQWVHGADNENGVTFTITDLAKEFDITTRTIRFYESHGLLNPRREGQKRVYGRRDRTQLKLTLRGKRLGMTLGEIREVFDLYDQAHGEERQLERYLDILAGRREALLRQRRDLDDALEELEESERRCREVLAQRGKATQGG